MFVYLNDACLLVVEKNGEKVEKHLTNKNQLATDVNM